MGSLNVWNPFIEWLRILMQFTENKTFFRWNADSVQMEMSSKNSVYLMGNV